jgi:hypothetical protein
MEKSHFFRDILKSQVEGNLKYSQGRTYLFLFVILYVATLAYNLFAQNPPTSIPSIISALQWAILLFSAYVFGTNGLSATKEIFKIKNGKDIVPMIENVAKNAVAQDTTTTTQDMTPISFPSTQPISQPTNTIVSPNNLTPQNLGSPKAIINEDDLST